MLKIMSYYKSGATDTVEANELYLFGELWDGDGDGEEILESGAIAMVDEDGEDVIVNFELAGEVEDIIADTLVLVTSL